MSIQDLTIEDLELLKYCKHPDYQIMAYGAINHTAREVWALRKRCDELQGLYEAAHGHRCRLTHLVRRLIANIQVLIIMHESPGFYNAEKAIGGAREDWEDANNQQMIISDVWEKRESKID